MERKRARQEEGDVERREKLSRTDLTCPICFDIFNAVHVTTCGHSFCHDCIERCLSQSPECPVCKVSLPPNVKRLTPNFSLNDVVARVKSDEKYHAPNVKSEVNDLLAQSLKLDDEDFKEYYKEIEARKKVIDTEEKELSCDIHTEFLEESIRRKEVEYDLIGQQLNHLRKEFETVKPHKETSSSSSSTGNSKRANRLLRLHGDFDDIEEGYFEQVHSPRTHVEGSEYSVSFREQLVDITRYSKFQDMATLFYGDLPVTSGSSIVSSIEFDKDGDFFAVGGVTRKIKIYDFGSVSVQNPKFNTLHYPVMEIPCQAKLSSVAYNPYIKHQLAASDYDGTLSVWDTHRQRCLHTFKEHEKRVWSVSYNTYDPALIATGGDDCSLKLWHLTKSHSIRSQPTRANVCSVRFEPGNRYNLAYGSADHKIRLVDIRKFNEPYLTLEGHRKAVSYVQYLNSKELVSASTDSELKLWCTKTGRCKKTFRGHINEKNFVGLTVNDDFIACGSENNSFCVYHKFVSKPILQYKFDIPHSVLPGTHEQREESNDFVSSVCFRKNSRIVLAANSLGYIKVLEMI